MTYTRCEISRDCRTNSIPLSFLKVSNVHSFPCVFHGSPNGKIGCVNYAHVLKSGHQAYMHTHMLNMQIRMSFVSYHLDTTLCSLLHFVFSSVNPFTANDAIWHPGVIIQSEINLSIHYKLYYTFYHLVHY